MIQTPVTRTVSALLGVVIVVSGLIAIHLLGEPSSQRALAADLAAGRSSAPRVLEEVGAVPDELKTLIGTYVVESGKPLSAPAK